MVAESRWKIVFLLTLNNYPHFDWIVIHSNKNILINYKRENLRARKILDSLSHWKSGSLRHKKSWKILAQIENFLKWENFPFSLRFSDNIISAILSVLTQHLLASGHEMWFHFKNMHVEPGKSLKMSFYSESVLCSFLIRFLCVFCWIFSSLLIWRKLKSRFFYSQDHFYSFIDFYHFLPTLLVSLLEYKRKSATLRTLGWKILFTLFVSSSLLP